MAATLKIGQDSALVSTASPKLPVTVTRIGDERCGRCHSVHPVKMNPWGICPEPVDSAAVTLDVWGTTSGSIDGVIELAPGSSIGADRARDLVVAEMRAMLDPEGEFRREHDGTVGGMSRPSIPEERLDSPTCVLTMSWDEQGRRMQGPGFGPLGNDRRAPASVVPIRDLIEWTLLALGATGNSPQ